MMHRPDVIDALWSKIEDFAFITKAEFERGLRDWEIEVVRDDGRIAFVTMVNGPEFHFESFGLGLPITPRMIRERLEPIIERHGYVTTKTPTNETRQQRFNKIYGFKEVGCDEFFIHYRLDKPCP